MGWAVTCSRPHGLKGQCQPAKALGADLLPGSFRTLESSVACGCKAEVSFPADCQPGPSPSCLRFLGVPHLRSSSSDQRTCAGSSSLFKHVCPPLLLRWLYLCPERVLCFYQDETLRVFQDDPPILRALTLVTSTKSFEQHVTCSPVLVGSMFCPPHHL